MKLLLLIFTVISIPTWAQLYINEASNANGTTIVDPGGNSSDWLEIYNSSGSSLNLQGYGLSDNISDPLKWKFPVHQINGNSFLTVLASGNSDTIITNHFETAVFSSDTWDYYIPNSNMVNDWNTNPLASVSWTSAPLSIGYGDGDDITTLAGPLTSVYVRKIFTVSDEDAIVTGILDIDYDDGFVAYLNGIEIARSGLTGIPPNWDDLASDHEALLYQGGQISNFIIDENVLHQALVNGINILSIEVHNTSTTSSDLSLNPYLTFGFNEPTVFYSGTVHPYFNAAAGSAYYSTNFSIKTSGETIYLSDPSGIIIDTLTIVDLEPNMSVGKLNDGTPSNFIFTIPTPGSSNNFSNGYLGYEPEPTVNINGGFYSVSIQVSVTNNSISGGIIRYTLTGQTPNASSPIYTGPITIGVNTVLQVRCFPVVSNLLPGRPATESYFILEDFSLPVISITTDPSNLYGANGIFDNYNTDWRKPCTIEYFDNDGLKQFESRASIKPDGGAGGSRSNPQHSVTIEPANNLYGEGTPVNYPLIPEKSFINEFYAFYLRNGSNYWNQYPQKDATFMRTVREIHANSQAYTPVIAYINGQYFGVYELREKANEGYFENNYGNDRDSLDLLSVSYFYGPGILRTVKGSDSGFYNMKNFISSYDPLSTDYFSKCHEKLDLYNFTDYISSENWFANADWIYNNIKIARTRTFDNKWRFFLQDMELGLGGWTDYNANIFDYFRYNYQPNPYWEIYNGLIQNTTYRNYFINRFADLMNTTFKEEHYQPIIDSMYNQLLPEMPRHFQLWTGDIAGGMAAYAANKDVITFQMANRNTAVRNQMQTEFGLQEQVDVYLKVLPAGAGYIKISTIIPENLPWSGVYFDGNPVRMTAVANPGYTFIGWQANTSIPSGDLGNSSIEMNIPNDDNFVALFTGSAEPVSLTISEINYNPDSTVNGGNWIELHNFGTAEIDLTGWNIKSKNFWDKYEFEDQVKIQGGAFLVVCQDTNLFKIQHPTILNFVGSSSFNWSNNLDTVKLFNAFNQLVISAAYEDGDPYPKCADGWGRTLENVQFMNDQLDSTVWFCGCIGGSPGKAYEPCVESVQFTEINYNNINAVYNAGDWVEIRNQTALPIDLSGYYFKDSKNLHKYDLPDIILESGQFLVLSNDLILFDNRHGSIDNVSGIFDFGIGSSDVLRLYDETGILVTSVVYDNENSWPITPSIEDYTLEYKFENGFNDPNNSESWFVGCEGGSPGRSFEPCPVLPDDENLFLYPNPTYDVINIVFDNENNSSNVTELYIFDIAGNIVYTETISAIESVVGKKVDVGNLRNGVYYVKIVQDGSLEQMPFVKI